MKHIPILFLVLLADSVYVHAQSPEITIVHVYEGMASYAEAVATNPASDRNALWRDKVIDPYWQRCAEGGEYMDYAPPLKTPFTDIRSLSAAIATLRASSIDSVVRSTLQKAGSILPGTDTVVCLIAADSSWIYLHDMHGVGGFTAGAGKIWLTILPGGDWKDWIANAVAHEYHHSVWTKRHGRQNAFTMAEYLVFEGRADSFARLVDPQHHAPWTNALTPQQEKAAWGRVKGQLHSTSPASLLAFMHGGNGGIPSWAGYTIGFHIVQAFLKGHPDLSVSQWTAIPADELVGQSSYVPGAQP